MVGSHRYLLVRKSHQQVLLPFELVRFSNRSCCLFLEGNRCWVEALVERRGRRFPEASSSPHRSEDSFASPCLRATAWILDGLC